MVKELKYGKMEQFTKDNGNKIMLLDLGNYCIRMEINIKDILKIKKHKDLEYIIIQMEQYIKEIGKMIYLMDMANKYGRMDQNLKEILKKD